MIQLLNLFNLSINKATKIFFLSALFSNSLYSSSILLSKIEETKLYDDTYWSKLFHYRDGKSEIDSDNFFISKNGKTNLKEELFETINALTNGKKDVLCRFPLRVKWLKEKIPALEKEIKNYECKDLDLYIKEIDAKYASLIFPSAHINSPASMYGHTFLRIGGNLNTPLISNAVNYAAQTEETNGLIFAYKGIFGGYKGQYSILPYYKKIKEYSNLEQRDIWEYDLNLEENEVFKMALHSYELKDSFSFYHFFLENCSYNLLWLFEIAREDLDLVKKFKVKAVPLDTIKILTSYNLIKNSNFRYSKMAKMKYILNEQIENKTYLNDYLSNDIDLNNKLSFDDKVAYLDLKIEYIQYLRSENKLDQKTYIKKYLKLLKLRSSFDKISEFNIKNPKNPLYSHGSSKLKFTYSSDDSIEFGIKPVYNDIYDVSDGYLDGAYIDFFDLNIKKADDKLFIDKFTILKIKSLAKRDIVFKPISWAIDLSYERFKSKEDYLKLKPQIGLTYGNEDFFIYTLLHSNLYNKLGDNLISLGSSIGAVSNSIKNTKIGINYSYDKYNQKFDNKVLELFSTYKFSKNSALNLKYTNDDYEDLKKQDNISISLFYYF